MKDKKTLLLIDSNALIHRAYHALPPLMTKKGELVNAVYGFTSTLLTVIEKFKPDYIAASFDLKAPTFRHKEFKEYKATRTKAPDELYDQIPRVKKLVETFNIPIYEQEGFEADDVIGTLAHQADKNGEIETVIVTGDMDTLQLVSDGTKVFTLRRGIKDTVVYDIEGVVKKYGLTPEQLPDFKGLRGDPSDNIPGVKGVGEKTASTLLQQYRTLEGVYENIEDIKGSTQEKLKRDKLQAIQSKKLGTIVLDVPVVLDLDKCQTHEFDRSKVQKLFGELNFFSLLKRLPGAEDKNQESRIKNQAERGEVQDFKFEVVTEKNIKRLISEIKKQGAFAYELDVAGEKFYESELRGVALSYKTGRSWYIPYEKSFQKQIKELFEEVSIKKIGYEAKRAVEVCMQEDISFYTTIEDILIEAYLLQSSTSLNIEQLILEEFGEEFEESGKKGQMALNVLSREQLAEPLCKKVDYIYKLHTSFQKKMNEIADSQKKGRTIRDVLENIELPLIPILAQMEMNGIQINTVILKGILEKLEEDIGKLEKTIYRLAGEKFNINSPKQLAEILFVKMKISVQDIKKTKTGYSTASSELQKIKDDYEIAGKVEEYRELFKLKTTYLDVLPELVDKESRIHSTFNQAVTATGRLSSTDPNLQNIPIRTDLGRLIRTAFVAPKGKRLISADYSQIDLRCAAHVSQDKKLMEAFHRGEDIHAITAAEVHQVTPSQVTKTMRREAKVLNFGVLYGMGSFGFARAAGISREEAQEFIGAYMKKFSGIAMYLKKTKQAAKKFGYVETLFGRRRYIPEINSANFQVVSGAERIAINMPIQGLTADIMKLAMIEAEKLVKAYEGKAKTILQIHDELIFEIDEDVEKEFKEKIRAVMEGVYKLSVPLIVDVSSGDSWAEL